MSASQQDAAAGGAAGGGDRHVLAVDHGTSGIKAAIVSARGEVIDFAFAPTPIRLLPGGGAEQDPEDWWSGLVAASRVLLGRGRVPTPSIRAVCVSSTFSTTVAVDQGGHPLAPALTWMDSRGAPYVARALRGFPSVMGYGLRKALRWVSRTAGVPSLSGKDDAAHVLLVRHEWPEVYRRTHLFLPSKDWLNHRLTGRFAASYDSMHLFWVTDCRDLARIRYDDQLIAALGIDRDKLPPLRASTDVLGTLSPGAADALGLAHDVAVVMGSPDHQCALVGSGAVRDFEAHLYVGTSSWIECLVPFKKTDPLHSIASFPTAIPGRYQCIDEQDLAGGALGFLADNVLARASAIAGGPAIEHPFELLDRVAAAVPAGSRGLLFTPWLNGERTPVDDVDLRGGFHNISTTSTLDDMVRAVLEGVACNTRWMLGPVERFVGRRLEPIRIVGGGGRSELWCQIFADVLDREIQVARDPMQANARGAALIAAVGLGWISFADVPGLVPVVRTHRPDPTHRRTYDRAFDAFLRIHRRNRAIYRRLNRVGRAPGAARGGGH